MSNVTIVSLTKIQKLLTHHLKECLQMKPPVVGGKPGKLKAGWLAE